MNIKATEIDIVPIEKLVPNPKNPNNHPKEQIERLKKIIEKQGFRNPLVVSKLSGFVVSGHGRLEVGKSLGMKELPVIFQDFESEDQEYAHMIADNAISEWAELDLSFINSQLPELGPDLDVSLLGIKDFEVEPLDKLTEEKKPKACPQCGFVKDKSSV